MPRWLPGDASPFGTSPAQVGAQQDVEATARHPPLAPYPDWAPTSAGDACSVLCADHVAELRIGVNGVTRVRLAVHRQVDDDDAGMRWAGRAQRRAWQADDLAA